MARRGTRGGRGRRKMSEGARNEAAYRSAADLVRDISGWGGAEGSSRRGWIYWPDLDTRRELSSYSRTELLRKSRWLRANMGLPKRICGGLADLLGYLIPQFNSGDARWDEEAAALWAERANSPAVMDAAGAFGIDQLQIEMDRAAFGDGDVLPVVIEGAGGGKRLAMYEAHQLANPEDAGPEWVDGVRLDKFRRHEGYGIQGEDRVRTISARDAIWYGHPDALGRVRPPTVLAPAINHLHDASEILADWKTTIKVAAQWGIYLKQAGPQLAGAGPRAVMTGLRNDTVRPPLRNDGTAPAADGSDDKPLQVEDVYRAAGALVNLDQGMDVGVVSDDRPHPNGIRLLEWMVRDICWGSGAPPEILWDISGLRGANNRLLSSDLARWISGRLLRKRAWMRRFVPIWTAGEMRAGRLSEPAAGAKFWRVTFIPQAPITADRGREGTMNMNAVARGLRSLKTHFGEEQKNWLDEIRQVEEEKRTVRELLGEEGLAALYGEK